MWIYFLDCQSANQCILESYTSFFLILSTAYCSFSQFWCFVEATNLSNNRRFLSSWLAQLALLEAGWSRMYSSDRILIKNKSTDLEWMRFLLYICWMLWLSFRKSPRWNFHRSLTIEIPLIFPYKKDIFWSYPIFMFILSYSVVCSWYAYYHNSNLKDLLRS